MGKAGSGKSSLGNSIMRKVVFQYGSSLSTVTQKITGAVCEFNGMRIKVVDGPGIGDGDKSKDQTTIDIINSISEAITINSQGYHAFLFVLKFGNRLTDEDKNTISFLKKIFGEYFFVKYCVLVMTYGDLYEQESCTDFLDWVSDQKSGVFREFLQECDNRIVLFNNKTSDKEKQEGQLMKLLNIVKTLKLQNCRYADEHYFTGKTNRDYLTVQAQKDFIEKEAMEGANFINETLKILLGSRGSDRDILLFNDMLNKANNLQKFIKDKDKGTGVLVSVSHYVSSIISSIENELQIYNRITEEKDKFKLKVKLEAAENSLKLQKIREEYEHKIKKDKRLEALKMEKLQDQIKRMEDLKQSWRREMNNLERKHSIERSASNQQYQLLAKQFDEIKSLYEKQSRKERKKNIFTKMFQKTK